MVGEACLPSDAYFPWTPYYTPFIQGPCLSEQFCRLYDFSKYDFGMLIPDSSLVIA